MFQGKLRRVGNSLVITVPQREAGRLHLAAGEQVMVDLAGVETHLRFPFPDEVLAEMRQVAEQNRDILLLLRD